MDLDLLGAYDSPTALSLDAAHDGVRGRVTVTHAVAVRHLEEAVARSHRPELDRLEEDVVALVAIIGVGVLLMLIARVVLRPQFFHLRRETEGPIR